MGTSSECSNLYLFLFYICVNLCLCVCSVCERADNHLGQPAFCNHMKTAHDEVTVNSEPVLIISCVCFWICFTLSPNPLLFFSQYSYNMPQHGAAASQCGLSRELLNRVTVFDGPDLLPNSNSKMLEFCGAADIILFE